MIAKKHALTKKSELKDKITKMAMVDGVYSYKEAMSKIEYLDKNLDVLKGMLHNNKFYRN